MSNVIWFDVFRPNVGEEEKRFKHMLTLLENMSKTAAVDVGERDSEKVWLTSKLENHSGRRD